MKLRRLELDQFKKFERAVWIADIADGLNLVAGPNELGKTTLLDALRAVLFERHRSSAQTIRDLQHHRHQTAPWVALDFELEERPYRIEKRFLQRPFARLTLPDGRRVEGDPAEDMLQELLGRAPPMRPGGETGSLWHLLLVGQGSSLEQAQLGGSARQTLEASLQAELGALMGAGSGHAVCRAIEEQLYQLVDRRGGRPKGRYRQIEDDLGAAVRALGELDRRKADLEEDLERLARARADSRPLRAQEAAGAEPAALAAALERRDELLKMQAETRQAEAAVEIARRDLQAAEADLARREQLVSEVARAERARGDAESAGGDADRLLGEAATQLEAAGAELARAEGLRSDGERRVRLLETLTRSLHDHEQIQAALDDAAAEVIIEILPGALGRVRLGGERLHAYRLKARITDPLAIDIEGVGRIGVRPAPDRRERLLRRRDDCEEKLNELREELDRLAGGGSPLADPAEVARPLAEARRMVDLAAADGPRARALNDAALAQWHRAKAAVEHATVRADEARQREAELRRALALARDAVDETALAAAVHAMREKGNAAAAGLERLRARAGGENLDAVERRVVELRGIIKARTRRLQELELEVERLTARIELQQGAGLGEQIEAARRRIEQLERQREACRREAAILTLLRDVLRESEQDMKDHYLAPLVARIRPCLQLLFPQAEVAVDEHFRVTAITREAGGAEPFELLSHGTREQIAVLTRLAFAELLVERGMPAVVVLDDALVFSDDDRLARMFQVLERAALRVQVLIFTCRERAFAGLRAARPRLVEMDREPLVASPVLSA